jgi:hypothetical protein
MIPTGGGLSMAARNPRPVHGKTMSGTVIVKSKAK